MELDPTKKYIAEINTWGLNMLWSTKGYQNPDGTPVICYWDDIHVEIKDEAGNLIDHAVPTLNARSYVQSTLDDLEGDMGRHMEEKIPGYIQDEMENSGFGMRLDELIKCNETTYSYYWYNEENYPEGKPMDYVPGAPKDAEGRSPVDINIYVPVDSLTKPVIESTIDGYIRKFMLINDFEIRWVGLATDAEAEKEWLDEAERIKEWAAMAARGEKMKILMAPQFLECMYGEVAIKPLIERGLKHAEKAGDDLILTFEDEHTEIFKEPEEPEEEDHVGGSDLGLD